MTRLASQPSGIAAASMLAMPSRRSASASSITPPSEVIGPPSNATVTFLRPMAGSANGGLVSSIMADVDVVEGFGFGNRILPHIKRAYATSACPFQGPSSIRRALMSVMSRLRQVNPSHFCR